MWTEISYQISKSLANYPGDAPFVSKQEHFPKHNCFITTSSLNIGLHYGTHTDAPKHFLADGMTIEKVPVEHYIGECQVICVSFAKDEPLKIEKRHLPKLTAPRVLFATNTFDYHQEFNSNFAVLSDDVVNVLLEHKCCLIGVDTPSLDQVGSTDFNNHLKILSSNIAVIEGLNLREVKAGNYEMLALPLAFEGLEASPLRVLIKPI